MPRRSPRGPPRGTGGTVDLVGFARDGSTLVAANAAGLVTLWDVASTKVRATLSHPGGMITLGLPRTPSDWPPPERRRTRLRGPVESRGSSGSGTLSGQRVAVLPVPEGRVTRLALSPDGKTLAAATEGSTVMVWDVAGGEPRTSLSGHDGPVLCLAFSPDGATLASGGQDGTLRIWDPAGGRERKTLHGHADAIVWVAFSPDGKTVASASRDATVKLWDAPP
ncbi:MAG: hypothetical protein WKF75_01875 [Singulisphaera sp.]